MEALLNEKLPSKWTYGVTSDGRVFFLNDDSETSTWVHPNQKQTIQSGHLKNPDLPDGVEFDYTEDGILYFIDHKTSTNSWALQDKVEMRKHSKRSTSPFKRSNSKRKSLKKKSVDVKRNHNSEVVIRGWLHRQEGGLGPLKTWKKRWCVLSDLCLFIYKGPEEGELLGSVLLPSYKITPGQKDSANRKFIFKAEHENMKSEHFAGEIVEEAENWMEAMHLASMAVDVTGFEDKAEYTVSDDHLNLKASTALLHEQEGAMHDTQNPSNIQKYDPVMQNVTKNDYKNMELPSEQITARNNFHLNDPSSKQEASRFHERLDFRNSSVDEGCDKIPINIGGKSTQGWEDINVPNNLHLKSESMKMSLEGGNLSRVREWTEEQNKFRNDVLASRSFDEMPYTSSPIRLESRRWNEEEIDKLSRDNIITYPMESNIGSFKEQFGRHSNVQQLNQQSGFYQNNLLKINEFLDQSDNVPPIGNSILSSQEFAKNNFKDQYVGITKEQEAVKMRSSTKFSVSSNLSHLVRTSSPKMEDVSMKSTKQTSTDISSSPEPLKERGMSDIISNVGSHLEESHILLDMLNQLPCQPQAQKEQLVQILIQLRRDQTSLHEVLYNLTTDGNSDSIGQLQAVRDLINENSHMTDLLEGCLYGTSNKLNKAADLNITEIKVEPPKPRKRSTTQITSPPTTPSADASPPTHIENVKEPNRSEHDACTRNKEETRYNFEQQIKNAPNVYETEKRHESLMFAQGTDTKVSEKFKNMNSFIRNEQHNFRDVQNRIYNEDQNLKFNSKPYIACKQANEFSASQESNLLHKAEQSKSVGIADSFDSDKLKNPNQHVNGALGKNFTAGSDAHDSQNVQEARPFGKSEYRNYTNQDAYKLNLDQRSSEKSHNDNGIFGLEPFQFLETDLDSMHTYNIAKFSHGIKPSDLNKSSYKKTLAAAEIRSNIIRETKPKHHPVARGFEVESPAFIYMKQNLDSSHHKQIHYKNLPANAFHKDIAPNKLEFQTTDQHRQSFIPLKGSDYSSKSHTGDEMYQEHSNNTSSGARQRTHSLSNDEAKEFKDNMLRNVKSTQDLNKDEDTEDETQAGFQSRSNIRRLSGIFTPRPFYKSRSTNEVQNGSNPKDERSFVTDHPKGHISNGDDLVGGKLSSKNVEIPEQPRKPQTIQKLIKSQKRESSKWREGTEDEKSWRQQLLDQRLGHSQQPTSRTKYYGL